MREIAATWMRGGTSKCWVFRREDLQVADQSVDEVLLRLYGSPDHRQVDGVGGGTSTTSKAVILAPSSDEGVDVDYTFAQVGIEDAKVDWGSNCGNCSAVVAAFAIREGWVRPGEVETAVRVLNTNTDQLIVQHVPTPGGVLAEEGSTHIPGVPFGGAPVRMGFVDPAGRSTGRLFPSGAQRDVLEAAGVTVTLVDAGAPVVAVDVAELGLDAHGIVGDESPDRLDAVPGLLARLDVVRREAGVRMGLAETAGEVARAVPKLALVSPPSSRADEPTDLTVRMLSMGRFHPAVPVTGSVALTLAAATPGTVVADLVESRAAATGADVEKGLRLGSPAGCVQTFVETHAGLPVVGVTRTYRRLAQGSVVLPEPPLMPSVSA
ncbi:PrpF domain-containing protein [Nocardioides sp. CFH 31398]|uniref:PrpF domain-containing protein n=1 Tax=Nocardioides sp. CFH 31398 TaxID=2919579 RepID=UPI001F059781|nr:PrpF domain-containing protein [Nocardioides sp. CFH 31398]MCH1865445.1 methylitaconate delta2-delta3-isomerase [Nocardioides sp. CFH 31398]